MTNAIDPRFAPPQAHVEDRAPNQVALAGRGVRFLAALGDGFLGAGVFWALLKIPQLGPLQQAQLAASRESMWSWTPLSLVLGALIFLAIQAWPLVTRGQTLGKMLFKLRIVRSDGSKPEAWRLLGLRYGIGLLMNMNAALVTIYSLLDSLLIFRSSRKCLHDSIADTQVIKL
ncbi:RDD family protein [Inhella proteolytica]|uniref:RDD family protein n=1 Tax=Inhella proteolytica TaxID=2795029 RepID=A0A931J6T4_9BURK|nr:RDD family protein [Inhella proteolytica]MBH9577387.1 RDD family protein [Inhella proteolytica]